MIALLEMKTNHGTMSDEDITIDNIIQEVTEATDSIARPEVSSEKVTRTKPWVETKHRQIYRVHKDLIEIKKSIKSMKYFSDSSTDVDHALVRGIIFFSGKYPALVDTRNNQLAFHWFCELSIKYAMNDVNNAATQPSCCLNEACHNDNDPTRGINDHLGNCNHPQNTLNVLPIHAQYTFSDMKLSMVSVIIMLQPASTNSINFNFDDGSENYHTNSELVYSIPEQGKQGTKKYTTSKGDEREKFYATHAAQKPSQQKPSETEQSETDPSEKSENRDNDDDADTEDTGDCEHKLKEPLHCKTQRATLESLQGDVIILSSEIAILPSSSLDMLKSIFPSQCNHKSGVICLRHADIPGLHKSKSRNMVNTECSSLSKLVLKTKATTTKHPEDITLHSKKKTSEFRGNLKMNMKPNDEGHIRKLSNEVQLAAKSKTYIYNSDQLVISRITDLLHSGEFKEILIVIQPYLKPPNSISLIPMVFMAALSHFKLGDRSEAASFFEKGTDLCLKFGKLGDSALCELYLGDIHFLFRNFLQASSYYKKAISNYSTDTVAALFRMVPPSLSTIHSKYGSALKNASKIVDAIQEYKLAIAEAKTLKDRLAANTSLGNLYQSVGENTSALTYYEHSITIAQELGDKVSLGWAHGNIGNAFLGLFQKEKAIYHLRKSLDITLQFEPTPQAIGRAYNNLGTAYQSLNNLDQAEIHYEDAFSQAVYGNDEAGQARVCGNMGNILMLRKKPEEAVEKYSEVLSLSKDRSTLSTARHNRGCAYYEWGEAKKSESRKMQQGVNKQNSYTVFIHSSQRNVPEILKPLDNDDTIATLYRKGCDDLKEVIKYHEDHFENIRGSPKGLTLSVSLFETNSRTFHRLQDCLVCLGEYLQALLVAEQSRARTLGEMMLKRKGWQLSSPLSSPLSYDHIESVVGTTNHPILYLSYTGARLLGWVFASKGDKSYFSMFEVPLEDDLFDGKSFDYHVRCSLTESLVERSFEMYREVGDYSEGISAPVQALYKLIGYPLITILQSYGIESIAKIVIICDSYTALVPFTSLHDTETDSFLGDHLCIQLMPSFLTMGILNQLGDTNVVNLPEDDQCMCIVGNPNIPQFSYNGEIWNLGKLPHAKREAESVAHILHTVPILEAQATKSAILMRILNSKIIHLATHGSASAGFLAFGMLVPLTSDKAVHPQGVLLYPEEVEKLNINPALVVLSSCDSGRGAVKADGIQGMARAFILAGAQAVLTTLWRVPDESAAIFMQFFYQYMMDGLESTKALQKAILSIRCFSKYSQYIHWSGYQLTGRDIYLKYTSPPVIHALKQHLGNSSTFPRLEDIKLLKDGLVNVSCYPTDVQVS